MSESSKYEAYKKKLQGICDENNLVYRFCRDRYPITLTIRPVSGLEEQMSMLESVEENGYTSPDAFIAFAYKDGALTYKTSKTFTISDALFSKIKNLYKNLHTMWCQFFFREAMENHLIAAKNLPTIPEDEDSTPQLPDEAEPIEGFDDGDLPDVSVDKEDPPGDSEGAGETASGSDGSNADDYKYEGSTPDAADET